MTGHRQDVSEAADALALRVLDAEDAHAVAGSKVTAAALDEARRALASALPVPPPGAHALVLMLGAAVDLAAEPAGLCEDPAYVRVLHLAGRALLGVSGVDDPHEAGTAAFVQLAAVVAGAGALPSPGFDLDL